MSMKKILKGLGLAKSGVGSLYHELRQDEKSFMISLETRVREHTFTDPELGITGTIQDIASLDPQIEQELKAYMQKNITGGLRARLARAYYLTAAIKDSVQDLSELVEGATLPLSLGENAIEVPLYAAMEGAYTLAAAILGSLSGTYPLTFSGTRNYLADMGLSFADAGKNIIPLVGLSEIGTHMGDPKERIMDASARRAEIWLRNRLRSEAGLAPVRSDPDLVGIVEAAHAGLRSARERAKGKVLQYAQVVKDAVQTYIPDIMPLYRQREPSYQTV